MRKEVEAGGNSKDKLVQVKDRTLLWYRGLRDRFSPVHGADLQAYALHVSNELGLNEFKASHSWLFNFKRE